MNKFIRMVCNLLPQKIEVPEFFLAETKKEFDLSFRGITRNAKNESKKRKVESRASAREIKRLKRSAMTVIDNEALSRQVASLSQHLFSTRRAINYWTERSIKEQVQKLIKKLRAQEREKIAFTGGVLYSSRSDESCGLGGRKQIERRVLLYDNKVFLACLEHLPILVGTGEMIQTQGYGRQEVMRETGEWKKPEILWVTSSLKQLNKAEFEAARNQVL